MIIQADGYQFDFTDAVDVFVFDEKDKSKPTYHGLPMKGVDIVAVFERQYVFVEIKDYDDICLYDESKNACEEERKRKHDHFKWLKNYLKYKFRDTFLFRYAEQKTEFPIHYICLLSFDNALNAIMNKNLVIELPVGLASCRWKQEIATSCHVVNLEKWNQNFPGWPAIKIGG